MAATKNKSAGDLLTLTEVSSRTGISMPTLQRYKKLYQARIPSEGKGRKQRYPAEALKVFEEIKEENIGRRGRPRKDASAAPAPRKARGAAKKSTRKAPAKKVASTRKRTAAKKAEAAAESSTGLLTLAEIGRRTGISYPTLSRYVKQYGDRLKSEGAGRARRFYEEAVEVFHELRSQTGRGRKAGAADLMVPHDIVKVGDIPVLGSGKTDYAGARTIALEKLGLEERDKGPRDAA